MLTFRGITGLGVYLRLNTCLACSRSGFHSNTIINKVIMIIIIIIILSGFHLNTIIITIIMIESRKFPSMHGGTHL